MDLTEKLNELLAIYILLKETSVDQNIETPTKGMIDLDSFQGLCSKGLEIYSFDISNLGQDYGVLERYEDELYYINETSWHNLKTKFESQLSNLM